jgi:hypothetical protein
VGTAVSVSLVLNVSKDSRGHLIPEGESVPNPKLKQRATDVNIVVDRINGNCPKLNIHISFRGVDNRYLLEGKEPSSAHTVIIRT